MVMSNRGLRQKLASLSQDQLVVLRNAALPGPDEYGVRRVLPADIGIIRGRIGFVVAAGAGPATGQCIDLAGRMIWPRFADIHVHLDKGHVLYRTGPSDGTLHNAIAIISEDRARNWNADELKRRMDFGLRSAWHYGTAMVRTHIDSQPGQWEVSWELFEDIRREWAGRIALQGSSLVPITLLRDRDYAEALARRVAAAGGSFGAVAFAVQDLPELLDSVFRLAVRHGLDVDFHADENGDPESRALFEIARTALKFNGEVRVIAGHCCSLSVQDQATRGRTLDAVARAGIGVVSLPASNLYLQGRKGREASPNWRGLTAFKEAGAAGIALALASDNTRDPFHPFGDLDMLDTFRLGIRALHLDDPVSRWVDTATTGAARMVGHEIPEIAEGNQADFIVFEGRSFSEVLARGESERIVMAGGRPLTTDLPPYADLDTIGLPNEFGIAETGNPG